MLVVDGASMTDDRHRARPHDFAGQAGTKIIEVGDPHQLHGVGCGSAFSVLHQALGGPELETNWRHRDPGHRQVLADSRDGRCGTAVEARLRADRALPQRDHDQRPVETYRRQPAPR